MERIWLSCRDLDRLFPEEAQRIGWCCGSCHGDADEFGYALHQSEIQESERLVIIETCCRYGDLASSCEEDAERRAKVLAYVAEGRHLEY